MWRWWRKNKCELLLNGGQNGENESLEEKNREKGDEFKKEPLGSQTAPQPRSRLLCRTGSVLAVGWACLHSLFLSLGGVPSIFAVYIYIFLKNISIYLYVYIYIHAYLYIYLFVLFSVHEFNEKTKKKIRK